MDEEYKPIITDEERATRRAQRAEARRKKQREKRRRLRRLVPCGLLAVLCVGLVTVGAQLIEKPAPEMVKAERPFQVTSVASAPAPEPYARAVSGPDTIQLGEDFPSRCAVLVDLDTRTVLAEKNADTVISPASMTKVLTVLVAAEHITEAELDDTFTMTIDITDYCYVNGCSVVGLMVDETVPVRELFYGPILSSGADAALGLATYVAGSQEAFVALMNEKAAALGMTRTSFANPNGLDAEGHYSTARDMAVLAAAAMEEPTFRRICSSRSVTIGQRTMENHNRLLRQVEGCIGLKTGYTKAAGRTLVSCAERGGCRLIAVTLRDSDDWADHAALYEYGFCLTAPRMTAQQVAERMHRTVTEVWAAWIQWESGDA